MTRLQTMFPSLPRAASLAFAFSTLLATSSIGAQNATVRGKVLADSTERALPNAEVNFPLLKRSTRSDSSGSFILTDIKPGRQRLQIRLLGYEPFESWLVIKDNQNLEADFLLKRISVKLDEVEVRAAAGRKSVRELQFDENRQAGTGRFLTQEMIEKDRGRPLGTMIAQRMPGLNVLKPGTAEYLSSGRDQARACLTQVFLNGLNVYRNGMPPFDLSNVDTRFVIGVEYYTANNTPAKYTGLGSGCGTVVIWTKD